MAKTSRRTFLQQSALITAWCCAGGTGSLTSCGVTRPAVADTAEDDQGLYVPLSAAEGKNSMLVRSRRFDEPLLLMRRADGTWQALLMRCPHKGCTVVQRNDKLVCPCHGSEFTPEGQLLKGPARQPLTSFPVTATSKHLEVRF
ncbi:MAG: Rieske (2Fe-2S) protein [Chitinophagales bacterium]|nr:Rieske (2Fe-2S) protein [Chitinophagales bacterium]MDW8428123.1 Rieske (2Fe-2S) protein [Chitinophagales bacterium]